MSFYGDFLNTSAIHVGKDLFFVNLHNISKNVFENNSVTLEMVFKKFSKNRELDENNKFHEFRKDNEYAFLFFETIFLYSLLYFI